MPANAASACGAIPSGTRAPLSHQPLPESAARRPTPLVPGARVGVDQLAPDRGRSTSLRQRIFTASQAGDLKKVRNLQRLMLRSRANALVSVRRVTELNAGRKTAGVDGKIVVSAPGKAALADRVRRHAHTVTAQPVKRVYVPKANGKQRG